jgi:hypothetical protein
MLKKLINTPKININIPTHKNNLKLGVMAKLYKITSNKKIKLLTINKNNTSHKKIKTIKINHQTSSIFNNISTNFKCLKIIQNQHPKIPIQIIVMMLFHDGSSQMKEKINKNSE